MVVRARSFAVLALAATPVAAAHASTIPAPAGTPSFNCDAAWGGGSINWGDGASLLPSLGLGASPTDTQLKYESLGCSNGMFSEALGSDNYFQLKFEVPPPDPDLKFELESFDVATGFLKNKGFDSLWDITLTFVKFNADGVPVDYKDFVGLKIESQDKWVNDASLKIENGALIFDPTNPGGDAVVSLYSTPQVPEPTSLVLLGTGLLGIGAAVRCRLGW